MHNKIRELSLKRIEYLLKIKSDFYEGPHTYVKWIRDELEEAEIEIKDNNSVYLEDELWDVFWDYICLLHSLKKEWKIQSIDNVFERCYKKYVQRVGKEWNWGKQWWKIKNKQKDELKLEHKKLYPDG
jgi:NTP pyrophosphatase (non-canonical NTP hydrolase)